MILFMAMSLPASVPCASCHAARYVSKFFRRVSHGVNEGAVRILSFIRAARANVSGETAAVQKGGCGRWMGLGRTRRSGAVTYALESPQYSVRRPRRKNTTHS